MVINIIKILALKGSSTGSTGGDFKTGGAEQPRLANGAKGENLVGNAHRKSGQERFLAGIKTKEPLQKFNIFCHGQERPL